MFIKNKEKNEIKEQLAALQEYKSKQDETIELIRQDQERHAAAFSSQIAVLEESKAQQNEMLRILSEQNAELQKTNNSMLEQRDRNEAVLAETLGKIAEVKKSSTVVYTEEQKKKAAYALNLCMVSISQIVDYDDLYILDQEYEMILNNLNLENMPKDEALLNILKQTLDTITYFRIQESEKDLIEREYQHNIKNALWASVPRNLNIMTCGESPWAIVISAALSLTCQVGTGYMNYRRNKADYKINKAKLNWQLQKSAMEQFNGLRRDLFDTAWRLADEYRFADELRLTEKQIDLYNEILDDQDDFRKYERLSIISDAFDAYPPFWYFIGDAAARIATRETNNTELVEKFTCLAKAHFDKFISMSTSNLLRENTLLATCALEYIDLLNTENDKDQINSLLEIAVNNAGNENDILDLIGVAYMKIEDYEKATYVFRRLINEGYNLDINVQLLSSLYVQEYLSNPNPERKKEIETLYLTLLHRTRNNDMFRLPVNQGEDWNTINTEFVTTQQDRVVDYYNYMVEQLEHKYIIMYNKLLPLDLYKKREYTDNWYLDGDEGENQSSERRYKEIEKHLKHEGKFSQYCMMYNEESYSEKTLQLLSELNDCVTRHLSTISSLDDNEEMDCIRRDATFKTELVEYITDNLSKHSSAFKYIDKCFENRESGSQCMEAIRELCFKNIVGDYFTELSRRGEENIRRTINMRDLFGYDSDIQSLSIEQGIELKSRNQINANEEIEANEISLNVIYGDNAQSKIEDKLSILNKKREMVSVIKEFEKDIVLNPDEVLFLTDKSEINKYVSHSTYVKKLMHTNIIAIFDDRGRKNKDIIFTIDGMYIMTNDRYVSAGELFKYQDTQLNKTNQITFVRKSRIKHTQKIQNNAISADKMYALIVKLADILKE